VRQAWRTHRAEAEAQAQADVALEQEQMIEERLLGEDQGRWEERQVPILMEPEASAENPNFPDGFIERSQCCIIM
jgi:hypothetical protein